MTYDQWKTTDPAERYGYGCACMRCHSDEARYSWSDHTWLCADCVDEELYEAREPLVEQDIDQIDFEIAEYDARQKS